VTQYTINLAEVRTFADLIAAFNAGLIARVGGHWNGNLDALNDYLYWPEPHPYGLLLVGWARCAAALAEVRGPDGGAIPVIIEEFLRDNPQVIVSFG
jgi:hypothetical protein